MSSRNDTVPPLPPAIDLAEPPVSSRDFEFLAGIPLAEARDDRAASFGRHTTRGVRVRIGARSRVQLRVLCRWRLARYTANCPGHYRLRAAFPCSLPPPPRPSQSIVTETMLMRVRKDGPAEPRSGEGNKGSPGDRTSPLRTGALLPPSASMFSSSKRDPAVGVEENIPG